MRFSGSGIGTVWGAVCAAAVIVAALTCPNAQADPDRRVHRASSGPTFELSALGSYSKTDFGNGTYETTRRYTGTFGWFFFPVTELELSYDNSKTFFNSDPVQTTTTLEQSLALSIVQSLTPPHSTFQPYVKGGVGQYDRSENGTVSGVPTTPSDSKAPTGILGGGIRIFLFRGFSLKAEGTAYLPNFNMSGAVNNFDVQGGLSIQF